MSETTSPDSVTGPLAGLLVLDLSQGLAGPYCTLMLRQQGARVVKVESPTGDWSRSMGRSRDGHSGLSVSANAGKESVRLDTRTPGGRAALAHLASRADVVVQAFRPGVADRLGVGYEEVRRTNPKVVYVSVSGFGDDGPWSRQPGLDTNVQALAGLMHANRDSAGRPRKIGVLLLDLATGMYAANATLLALYEAGRGARGKYVEVSLLQAAAAWQSYLVIDEAMFAGEPATPLNAPTGLYGATDGHVYVSTVDDAMFGRLALALGCTDWLRDEDLRTTTGRIARAAELNDRVASVILRQPVSHWERVLSQHDVVHGRMGLPAELATQPHSGHVGLYTRLDQPGFGPLPWAGLPGGGRSQAAPGPAPYPGQHTRAVLEEFGLQGDAPPPPEPRQ